LFSNSNISDILVFCDRNFQRSSFGAHPNATDYNLLGPETGTLDTVAVG